MRLSGSLKALMMAAAMLVIGSAPAAADNSLERIKKEGKFVVGIYNQAPWGWRDASGELKGFDVDIIKEALKPLGIQKIDVVITQFPALIPGLQAGRFDAATGGLYITPQRCKLVSFTETTLKVPDAAIVRAGNPKNIRGFADIANKKDVIFGATRGSLTAKHADMAGVPKDRQILFQDNQSTMSALLAGRVDVQVSTSGAAVALLSDPKVQGLERVVPFEGVKDAQGNEVFGNVGVAFRLEDIALRNAFDAEIGRMKQDGRLLEIMKRYGFTESETAATTPRDQLCKE
ncbi:ectoine/hydroxyectoine ABC transporter substrate-binding protein EhuB [Parapusillimonas granuli]|uniref:Ectoine/hydroxyectoine ABC transporter substrate-binding protein EhuB n=1 Tax=Parapusillimonas granuli TaxID=380911 RepID=A0A853FZD7_9BURK|nr:ectoine/hydroxyectoine ABC transporter substrate-binding protein EhuB [Parapusillimonas granuli]MBB5216514.1 polar amino acid transport system substrate-binding protein [Parapusillimonas granuli]MEB2399743.1 ectoine/hydroxyectoine ABC transporter substrate-binding protein EhuB [Alcaligenaceae bacterium]NYT48180.1 ectoine/hydroxyectoine ABC transporter substrate-binding protein EhuB [Parapusillimonas granuli]